MKVNTDDLVVHPESTGAEGEKLEPEEKLAQRVMGLDVPVSLGTGPLNGTPLDATANGAITADLPALEAARMLQSPCRLCAHFDRAGWRATRRAWSDPAHAEGFLVLNRMRAALLDQGAAALPGLVNGNVMDDVEHALNDLGICRALTDASREVTVVAENGCCPAALEDGTPFADSFRPARGGEAARESTAVYDAILHRAQGR